MDRSFALFSSILVGNDDLAFIGKLMKVCREMESRIIPRFGYLTLGRFCTSYTRRHIVRKLLPQLFGELSRTSIL
jgi:hypothetical protein